MAADFTHTEVPKGSSDSSLGRRKRSRSPSTIFEPPILRNPSSSSLQNQDSRLQSSSMSTLAIRENPRFSAADTMYHDRRSTEASYRPQPHIERIELPPLREVGLSYPSFISADSTTGNAGYGFERNI